MKEQCRTCGEWEEEENLFETDYQTYGIENEFVCEGCYDSDYGRCAECGEIRHDADLIKKDGMWICNTEHVDLQHRAY